MSYQIRKSTAGNNDIPDTKIMIESLNRILEIFKPVDDFYNEIPNLLSVSLNAVLEELREPLECLYNQLPTDKQDDFKQFEILNCDAKNDLKSPTIYEKITFILAWIQTIAAIIPLFMQSSDNDVTNIETTNIQEQNVIINNYNYDAQYNEILEEFRKLQKEIEKLKEENKDNQLSDYNPVSY